MLELIKTDERKYRAEYRLAVNRKDGTLLVWIPAGEFEMGDGKATDCPAHRVHVDGFWMGVYCVTNRQYGRFVKDTKHRIPDKADYGDPVWKNGQCPEAKMGHPVVCVSHDDCAAYAKWAGLSLPTEAQWEKACRGPKGTIYPWGNEWDDKKCRNDKNKGNEQTAIVGAYDAGVSGYGTYQQSGNVWEWCADWYDKDYYKASGVSKNPFGPATGSSRVYRGGCWRGDGASNFRGADRSYFGPANRNDYLGFRLVRMVS
jgi:formylglycine-generating enzyme required for sulfatase activity